MYAFDGFVGNELIKNVLRNAVVQGAPSHAYIIEGAPGTGKAALAGAFAKALQCEAPVCGGPCQTCVSCRAFESNNHPDVVFVAPVSRKTVGVDEVREQVGENIKIRPYKYKYKIFIIKNAGEMTPQAQNALLKALEEPAGYGVFLLTGANNTGILPTVLSRSVVLKLKPLPDEPIENYLLERGFSPEEARLFAAYARGSIGRALSYKEDARFFEIRDLVKQTVAAAADSSNLTCAAFNAAALFEPFKDNIQEVLEMANALLRDLLVYKTTGEPRFLAEQLNDGYVASEADKHSVKQLIGKISAVGRAAARLAVNANFSMAMDVLMMDLLGGY